MTAATLARRLVEYGVRSGTVLSVNRLHTEGLVTATPDHSAHDRQHGVEPVPRLLRLSDRGVLIADLLCTVLREQMLRVVGGVLRPQRAGLCGWSRAELLACIDAHPRRAAGMVLRHGYPWRELTTTQRGLVSTMLAAAVRANPRDHAP